MEVQEDQRVFGRFTTRFPAKFRNSRSDFGSDVFLEDLSAQGARLVSRERLHVDDSISLQIKLPDGHTQLVLTGQIVWSKIKPHGAWEIGLKFDQVKLMALQRLFKFCL